MSVITITPEAVMFGSVAFAPGVSWLGWLEEQVVGPVQALTLDTDDPRRVMWINEEGKITDLPPNMAATLLARHLGAIADDDWIAGSAVITGGTSNGDTAALTDAQLHHTYDQLAASFRTAAKTVATTAGN